MSQAAAYSIKDTGGDYATHVSAEADWDINITTSVSSIASFAKGDGTPGTSTAGTVTGCTAAAGGAGVATFTRSAGSFITENWSGAHIEASLGVSSTNGRWVATSASSTVLTVLDPLDQIGTDSGITLKKLSRFSGTNWQTNRFEDRTHVLMAGFDDAANNVSWLILHDDDVELYVDDPSDTVVTETAVVGQTATKDTTFVFETYVKGDLSDWDPAALAIAGATVDANRRRAWAAAPGDEYDPNGDTGVRLVRNAVAMVTPNEGFWLIYGMYLETSTTSATAGSPVETGTTGDDGVIERCYITRPNAVGASSRAINIVSGSVRVTIRNCIIDGGNDSAAGCNDGILVGGADAMILNCIVFGCKQGTAVGIDSNSATTTIKNCYLFENDATFDLTGGETIDYIATDLADITCTHEFESVDPDVVLVGWTSGDFTPVVGQTLAGAGETQGTFTDDFYRVERTVPWDIGPIERSVAAVTDEMGWFQEPPVLGYGPNVIVTI